MRYEVSEWSEAIGGIREIEKRVMRSFRCGISEDQTNTNNRQLEALRRARAALERFKPRLTVSGRCAECGNDLNAMLDAAEDIIHCCPYCGQAVMFQFDDEEDE